MSKAPSPLLGYNNNVRHKSRVFHIQTEDSGVKHPHIITHLFMDGGRILKSVKKSYSEHLGSEGLADVVRQMMKEQHKAMFIALRGGHFDHLVEAASDAPGSLRAKPANGPVSGSEAPASSVPSTPSTVSAAAPPTSAKPDSDAPMSRRADATDPTELAPAPAKPSDVPVSAPPTMPVSAPPAESVQPSTPPVSTAPPSPPETVRVPERETELTLDIDALEPPPAEVRVEAPTLERFPRVPPAESPEPLRDLSPQLFKKRADTFRFRQGKETRATEALLSTTLPSAPLPKPAARPPSSSHGVDSARLPAFLRGDLPPSSVIAPAPDTDKTVAPPSSRPGRTTVPAAPPASEGRYAPARPAAIFGHARPQQGSSIFGEDLISDKSLDEVILSYLAEDLESDKK